MPTRLQPYLYFNGRCEEALEFYREALGAEVEFLMRYNDSPNPNAAGEVPSGSENKIMHATLRIRETTLMACDRLEHGAEFEGFSLYLALPTEAEAQVAFSSLAKGGVVDMPLSKTFWSPCYGMLTDKFGLAWKISVE